MAVDSSNNVYVTDQGNNRIQKFESPLSKEVAMFTFAQTPTFQSDQKFEPRPTQPVTQLDVSDDGRALTLTFSAFELTIGASKSPAPSSTHVFSFVLPLEGEDNESVEIDFHVQGFVLTTEGATATVVLSVNGQTTSSDFPANSEESYLQSLKFTASSPPSECRLSVFLLVGRDSTNSDAEAFINTLSIDANIPRAPEGKGVTRMAEFEIYKDQDNPQDFRWHLRANNGEIIADSGEGYNDRDDCEHGIELVKSQAPSAQVQDLT
jgi:uncharacterized protein